jgi:hypothetical protein
MNGNAVIARRRTSEFLQDQLDIAVASGQLAGRYPDLWPLVEKALDKLAYPHEKLDLLYELGAMESEPEMRAALRVEEIQETFL